MPVTPAFAFVDVYYSKYQSQNATAKFAHKNQAEEMAPPLLASVFKGRVGTDGKSTALDWEIYRA